MALLGWKARWYKEVVSTFHNSAEAGAMADVVRLHPKPESSSSHSLQVHIDNARARKSMRAFLLDAETMAKHDPHQASILIEIFLQMMRDMSHHDADAR